MIDQDAICVYDFGNVNMRIGNFLIQIKKYIAHSSVVHTCATTFSFGDSIKARFP